MKIVNKAVPVVASLLFIWCNLGHAQSIYRWIDSAGNIHYTTVYEKIPPRYRNQIAEPSSRIGSEKRTHRSTEPKKNEKERTGLSPKLITKSSESIKGRVDRVRNAQHGSPCLIPTIEEVKEFLVNYMDCYTRKDTDGFVSLFSRKSVQDGKYRFEEIEKIYLNFFDQTQEIRYILYDVNIKIYEGLLIYDRYYFNVAEVNARYKVDQVLKKNREQKVWKGDIRWILLRENEELKILLIDYQHERS